MKHALLLLCLSGLSCVRRTPETAIPPAERPPYGAEELMSVCWPEETAATERVRLSFDRKQGRIQHVFFEALEGASNSTARCMRQVAISYPWAWSEVPERLELGPPAVTPSGWVVLAFHQLVNRGLPEFSKGLENPADLISACVRHGGLRQNLLWKVRPTPVSVSLWLLANDEWKETSVVSPEERCVAAVLGSGVYGSRGHTFDFSEKFPRPRAAPSREVLWYFSEKSVGKKTIAPSVMIEVMSGLKPQIETCWNKTLDRRWGLGGARTFHFDVSVSGSVEHAWVDANLSDAPTEVVDYLFDRCLAVALSTAQFVPLEEAAEGIYSWVFATR